MDEVRQTIVDALRGVVDPCCAERGLSVVDMGLVDDIHVADGTTTVDLVLTSGWCPFMVPLVDTIRARLADLDLAGPTDVRVVWDRAWSSDRLSATARQRLRFLPPPNQIRAGGPEGMLPGPSPTSTVDAAGAGPVTGPAGAATAVTQARGRSST